jgi:cobalt-zinc-cadmium efflux system membrane fusion protein
MKVVLTKLKKFVIGTSNKTLALFHAITGYLYRHPRLGKLVYGLLAMSFIAGGSYIAWYRWQLAQSNHDEHEAEVIHRSEEDLSKYGVVFADAATGKLAVELKVPGEVKLDGDKLAHMVPRFPGIVRQVMKNLGDTVKKGETLAIFENNANLSSFEMKSQLDGVIIEKNVALGEVIGSSDEAFVVADLSQVWVDLFIYPADLPRAKAGQRVRIIDQTSGKEAEGTLAYVAPTISDHTRTALARVVLPNPELMWRPGTFVMGAIVVDESDVPVAIDAQSIQDISGVPTVFVKKDNTVVATPVRIGRRDDKRVEVIEGVTVGARIATSGSFLLKSELTKGSAEHEH